MSLEIHCPDCWKPLPHTRGALVGPYCACPQPKVETVYLASPLPPQRPMTDEEKRDTADFFNRQFE